jgi:hypothetical protein
MSNLGHLRFQSPTSFGPQHACHLSRRIGTCLPTRSCPQHQRVSNSSVTTTTADSSEDCLVLKVYTPTSAFNATDSLPILVYIRTTRTGLYSFKTVVLNDQGIGKATHAFCSVYRTINSLESSSNPGYVLFNCSKVQLDPYFLLPRATKQKGH